jgi:hypothetical protein
MATADRSTCHAECVRLDLWFDDAGVLPANDMRAHLGTIGNLWYRGWTREWSEWMRPMGRLLVLLTTLLVLVMPVTEHLCNWDHFLRGGQDVEFNLLAGLLFAAMVVLSMSGRMIQPLLMQPLLLQPEATATIGACGKNAPLLALVRRGASQWAASLSSCLRRPDDSASAFDSRMLPPLRI